MKKQNILRTIVAAAAIAAAPVVFAGAASAQSHGHGGGGSHGGWSGGHGGGSSHGSPGRGSSGPSHGSWNGGHDNHFNRGGHGRDVVIVNRGRGYYGYGYRRPYYYGPSLALGFGLGYGLSSYGAYDTYYDSYYDGYNLYPGECRTDYRWDYWSGRPAEIALRICADGSGRTYVVRDSRRWVRWR